VDYPVLKSDLEALGIPVQRLHHESDGQFMVLIFQLADDPVDLNIPLNPEAEYVKGNCRCQVWLEKNNITRIELQIR
jgi:hypothetical protein